MAYNIPEVIDNSYRNEVSELVKKENVPDTIVNPGTIDAWRHRRMVGLFSSLVKQFPEAQWLTVGDNGADCWMLRQEGAKHVMASSITDAQLKYVASHNHLDGIEIRALNAEHMDLPDKSIDFILCKEAFHHFPRPPLALYEFMRVARKGVIFIEPAEYAQGKLFDIIRKVAKRVIRKRPSEYELFEYFGNYIYRLSIREVERTLTAIHQSWFSYAPLNDFYHPSVAAHPMTSTKHRLFFELGLGVQDTLCRLNLMCRFRGDRATRSEMMPPVIPR